MEMAQVKAGAHYFIISLYINNMLRSDIDINWVINAYPCIMGPYFCISIMKSFFPFFFLTKTFKVNIFINLMICSCLNHCKRPKCPGGQVKYPPRLSPLKTLYSQLYSAYFSFPAWLNLNSIISYSNPFFFTEGFAFLFINGFFSILIHIQNLYPENDRLLYSLFSELLRKRFDIVDLMVRPSDTADCPHYTFLFNKVKIDEFQVSNNLGLFMFSLCSVNLENQKSP